MMALLSLLLGLAAGMAPMTPWLEDITLRTQVGGISRTGIAMDSPAVLALPFDVGDEVCQLRIRLKEPWEDVDLLGSADFDVLDSIVAVGPREFSFKVGFVDLISARFPSLRLRLRSKEGSRIEEILLRPYVRTTAGIDTSDMELYTGQEKVLEVLSNHPDNLLPVVDWIQVPGFQYRTSIDEDRYRIHILPTSVGSWDCRVGLATQVPSAPSQGNLRDTVFLHGHFTVRKARLAFSRIDPQVVLLDERAAKEGTEVRLDLDRSFLPGKTYLLESSQGPGTPPVASLLVKERLNSNQVLGILRGYSQHRRAEGSLYLKDGDGAKGITNLDLLPKVRVDKVMVMRNGHDWLEDVSLYPGETVRVRIEGQSLDQAHFGFGELASTSGAKDLSTETVFECRLRIPLDIAQHSVPILDHGKATGKSVEVQEYRRIRPLDYVAVDYGSGNRPLQAITGPELSGRTIPDVLVRLDGSRLDSGSVLFGKQYLDVDVKVTGPSGNLLDYATIHGVVVCPDTRSVRADYYDRSDCGTGLVSLNEHLNLNTYDLEDWSRIALTIGNTAGQGQGQGAVRRVYIYKQASLRFDVDVSFPFGLLIRKFGEEGWGNFSGVSMATMAKLGFYRQGAIAKREPYELAAGFIALDAFNLDRDAKDRDLAAVALVTLNPTDAERKLSFPIYLGAGYLLAGHRWFWLIGPGISVQF